MDFHIWADFRVITNGGLGSFQVKHTKAPDNRLWDRSVYQIESRVMQIRKKWLYA
jgi:hypothetical protein